MAASSATSPLSTTYYIPTRAVLFIADDNNFIPSCNNNNSSSNAKPHRNDYETLNITVAAAQMEFVSTCMYCSRSDRVIKSLPQNAGIFRKAHTYTKSIQCSRVSCALILTPETRHPFLAYEHTHSSSAKSRVKKKKVYYARTFASSSSSRYTCISAYIYNPAGAFPFHIPQARHRRGLRITSSHVRTVPLALITRGQIFTSPLLYIRGDYPLYNITTTTRVLV